MPSFNLLCWLIFFTCFGMLALPKVSFWTTHPHLLLFFGETTRCGQPRGYRSRRPLCAELRTRIFNVPINKSMRCGASISPLVMDVVGWMNPHPFQPPSCLLFSTSEAGTQVLCFPGCKSFPTYWKKLCNIWKVAGRWPQLAALSDVTGGKQYCEGIVLCSFFGQ